MLLYTIYETFSEIYAPHAHPSLCLCPQGRGVSVHEDPVDPLLTPTRPVSPAFRHKHPHPSLPPHGLNPPTSAGPSTTTPPSTGKPTSHACIISSLRPSLSF